MNPRVSVHTLSLVSNILEGQNFKLMKLLEFYTIAINYYCSHNKQYIVAAILYYMSGREALAICEEQVNMAISRGLEGTRRDIYYKGVARVCKYYTRGT